MAFNPSKVHSTSITLLVVWVECRIYDHIQLSDSISWYRWFCPTVLIQYICSQLSWNCQLFLPLLRVIDMDALLNLGSIGHKSQMNFHWLATSLHFQHTSNALQAICLSPCWGGSTAHVPKDSELAKRAPNINLHIDFLTS